MKLSPAVFSIIFCVLVSVDGRCRKRRIKYIQPATIPAPPSYFNFQSAFEDDITGRDAGISSLSTNTPQHPNLSCLLFSDDGCNVSCGLMCDINGCQSDGYCSQKLYCLCNEIYTVKNQPVTADQFRKLTFDDLWSYKFKPTSTSGTLKNRIFQSDELYGFVMPLLQNPHKSGRDVKEALLSQYPKLSSAQNLQPREHGVKAKLFGDGFGAGEANLHRYIQNMMKSLQDNVEVYDRLNHTRYMRRVINLIKDIDNKEDLSYILRQIRQTGNDRLFERVRRYLMKRGYYFDNDLRPISKKSGFCAKKKVKCGCGKKFKSKPKRFFYGSGATSFSNIDDDFDWMDAEDEEEQIETALITELIGSNDAEGKYPSNTFVDEQPIPEVNYSISPQDGAPLLVEDVISIPPQSEPAIELPTGNTVEIDEIQMIPPNDSQYMITSDAAADTEYAPMPSQPSTVVMPQLNILKTSQPAKIILQKSNYPEYGTFFGSSNKNQGLNQPNPTFSANELTEYGNQQIPISYITAPETISYKKFVQPSNEPIPNSSQSFQSIAGSQYFDAPNPEPVDQSITISSQKSEGYPIPSQISQNPEKYSESVVISPIMTPQNLNQTPEPIVTQSQILEGSSKSSQPITNLASDFSISSTPQSTTYNTIQEILQPSTTSSYIIENPSEMSISTQDSTLATSSKLFSSLEPAPQTSTLQKSSQTITSYPENLLQQFATEKPTPKIPESSPYFTKSSAPVDLNTFDIPDAVPSIESLYVKHHQSPDKTTTPTTLLTSSSSSTTVTPPTIITQPESSFVKTHSTTISEPGIESPIFSETYRIQSPPTMQKPKDKIYYQVLMDENGNIIKSANYKYQGQPQYSQNTQQFSSTSTSPLQYTSTSTYADQPLFDKFDKQSILDAARAKSGQSMVLDYDLDNADDIPVFDIPSDIDILSGTFGVSTEEMGNIPTNYETKEYEIPSNMETLNEQITNMDSPSADSQYAYEIGTDNEYNVPINREMVSSSAAGQTTSQHLYEIDGDNHQIQTNDGLTLDYEENNPTGAHNWSAYSINDSNIPIEIQGDDHNDDTSTFGNPSGIISQDSQIIYHNSNSNEGGIDIEILGGSDEQDGNTYMTHGAVTSNASALKQHQMSYYQMNSSGEHELGDIDETASKFKSSKFSSSSVVKTSTQSSTRMMNDNSVPVKIAGQIDDAEDNSANCDDLVDPEDDLMNF